MKKCFDQEDVAIQKRIARAEKKALRFTGDDYGLVQRFWELVSMFPRITSPELEKRVERFILNGTAEQYYRIQKALFHEGTPFMLNDPKLMKVVNAMQGKSIGLSVTGVYDSTITLDNMYFLVEQGIRRDIPVISVVSRRDYADAILNMKDPVRLLVGRRIRASRKLTLLKWALPHLELLKEKGLLEQSLYHQPFIEDLLDENLTDMGY